MANISKEGKGNLLIEAVKDGNIVECRRLLSGMKVGEEVADGYVLDIHDSTNDGRSPIIMASSRGYVAIVDLLLSRGANIHDKDNDGFSPIIWASSRGYVAIVELLLSRGANIHDKDNNGWSSIIHASMNGYVDIVELLLSRGANIHDKDNNGWSSIIRASSRGYVDVIDLLLSKGANIHDRNEYRNEYRNTTSFFFSFADRNFRLLYRLRKWSTTMAIIMLQELALIYIIDSESVIDLHQYLGRPDECSKSDNEEDYEKDKEGNLLDPRAGGVNI